MCKQASAAVLSSYYVRTKMIETGDTIPEYILSLLFNGILLYEDRIFHTSTILSTRLRCLNGCVCSSASLSTCALHDITANRYYCDEASLAFKPSVAEEAT